MATDLLQPVEGKTFYTSDHHFQHARISELSGRPFATVEEMDEALIANWNAVVAPEDLVWVLGDYALGDWRKALGYLTRLHGRKRLIEGNHDRCWQGHRDGWKYQRAYLDAGFETVSAFARTKLPPTPRQQTAREPGRSVLLSHFPYYADHTTDARHNQFRLRDEGAWLVHGHVHGAFTVKDRGVNVGVDRWGFTPVPAESVAQIIDDVEQGLREGDQ